MLIAGARIPIDAEVSNFAAGATEMLSPDNDRPQLRTDERDHGRSTRF